MRLPSTAGRWQVRHGKDYFADIVRTRNLDFDEEGFIKLARKAMALYTSGDDANLSNIVAIVPDDNAGVYYIITSDGNFSVVPSPFAVTKLTTSSAPTMTAGSDAVFYNAILHVSGSTTVHSYATGTWTSRITGLSASYPHPLASFEDRLELSVGNGNTVKNYDTSYSNNGSSSPYTLTLPANYVVTCLRWREGRMYIGTRHIYGGEAKLFIWDGTAVTSPPGYGVGAQAIFSLADYEGSVAVLTSKGQLRLFNGGGFTELAHFPVYDTPYEWGPSASIATASFDRCPNRAMVAIGRRLWVNIKGASNVSTTYPPGPYNHSMPSGLWVFDPDVGLYHRAGHQHNKFSTLTVTSLDSSILTVGTHSLTTGDPVLAQSVSNITGLTQYEIYYAIVVNATQFQLALTQADALAGNYIILSGTVSGDTVRVDDTSSFGMVEDTVPGAICPVSASIPNAFYDTTILFGCAPFNDTGATIKALNGLGTQANRGSLTTSPIPAGGIIDAFQKLYALLPPLIYAGDKVVIKYRTRRRNGLPTQGRITAPGLANWTSTTTFTIDSTNKYIAAALAGDEMEIVSGSAAGYTSKITDITRSGTTYTVTVNDTLPVSVSDKSEIIVEDWTELTTFTSSSGNMPDGFIEQQLAKHGSFIQFKVELRGYAPKIRAIDVLQSEHKPAV